MTTRKEGSGVIYPQREKRNPKGPDWKGELLIDGKLIKISGWFRTSQYGQFISLNVDTWNKDAQSQGQQYPREVLPKGFDDNSVPF